MRKSFFETVKELHNAKEVKKGVWVGSTEQAFTIVESHGSESMYTVKHLPKKELDFITLYNG